jgi:hypothetical protein
MSVPLRKDNSEELSTADLAQRKRPSGTEELRRFLLRSHRRVPRRKLLLTFAMRVRGHRYSPTANLKTCETAGMACRRRS